MQKHQERTVHKTILFYLIPTMALKERLGGHMRIYPLRTVNFQNKFIGLCEDIYVDRMISNVLHTCET